MRRTLDLLDSLPPPFQPTARRMSWPEPQSENCSASCSAAQRKETKCYGERSDILAAGKEPTWGVARGIRSPERAGCWAGEKSVLTELEGRFRDACFYCARWNEVASERSLSPPCEGGGRGGDAGALGIENDSSRLARGMRND